MTIFVIGLSVRLAPLLHASFRPRLATKPLRFANPSPPSGWVEDFHLLAVEHARHTGLRSGRIVMGRLNCFQNPGSSLCPVSRAPHVGWKRRWHGASVCSCVHGRWWGRGKESAADEVIHGLDLRSRGSIKRVVPQLTRAGGPLRSLGVLAQSPTWTKKSTCYVVGAGVWFSTAKSRNTKRRSGCAKLLNQKYFLAGRAQQTRTPDREIPPEFQQRQEPSVGPADGGGPW